MGGLDTLGIWLTIISGVVLITGLILYFSGIITGGQIVYSLAIGLVIALVVGIILLVLDNISS